MCLCSARSIHGTRGRMTKRWSAMPACSSSQRQCQHKASTFPALTAALGGPSIAPRLEACRSPGFLPLSTSSRPLDPPICAWTSAVRSLKRLCSSSAQSPRVPHPTPLCSHGEGAPLHGNGAPVPAAPVAPITPYLQHSQRLTHCSCTSVAQPKCCQPEDGRDGAMHTHSQCHAGAVEEPQQHSGPFLAIGAWWKWQLV